MARMKDYFVIGMVALVVFTYLILGDVVCSKSYIVADRTTGLYHMPGCGALGNAAPGELVSFKESIYNSNNYADAARAAQKAGYQPCGECGPPSPAGE